MTIGEIQYDANEKLKEVCRIAEFYLPIGQQQRFGEWDSAKEALQDIIDEYVRLHEEMDEYELLQKKYSALQNELKLLSDELYAIDEIDTSEPDEERCVKISVMYAKSIDKDIATIASKLEDMSDEDWEPYKKKKK